MTVDDQPILIGREEARLVLAKAYQSPQASLVSVTGRRRVGKTFLVKRYYDDKLRFVITGLASASKSMQLSNFTLKLQEAFGPSVQQTGFDNWLHAMAALSKLMDAALVEDPSRKVIFFDELPWLSSPKSGFLEAFSWFWNSWAVDRKVVVVICGSAASWMMKKVVHNKGGLHNRITHRIVLQPFCLREAWDFMDSRGLVSDHSQRLQLFMALGGIPFYLQQLNPGESAHQAIDRLLFASAAPLANEFDLLYRSLFDMPDAHMAVVKALAEKQMGLTRNEVARSSKISSSGTLTRVLSELELSGFIDRSIPFGKKRNDALYRLMDEYSRFYLQWLEGKRTGGQRFTDLATTPAFKAWSGFAFENVALRHQHELRKAMGISGVATVANTYLARANEKGEGVQVELLLDRNDRTISLIESKFSEVPFRLTKEYAQSLRQKRSRFIAHSGTRKHVFLVLFTVFGLEPGPHSVGLVDQVLTVEDILI